MNRTWLRRTCVSLVIAVIAGVGTEAVIDLGDNPPTTPPRAEQQAPEPPQILRQTDLQKSRAALGPFETIAAPSSDHPDTKFPAVLLLRQDGSVAASTKWKLPFSPTTWAQQDVFQISKLGVDGDYATIESSTGNVYTVRIGQPFLMEGVPQQILLIDSDAQQWTTPISRAQIARQAL